MLCNFTWQKQPYSSLDFAGTHCRLLTVLCQAICIHSYTLENVANERVRDTHGFGCNSSILMTLLQHFVDVQWITFLSLHFLFFFLSTATPDFNVPAFFSAVISREGLCDFAITLQIFPLCYTTLFDNLRTLESHCNIASMQHKTGSGANFQGMHWRCIIFQLEIKILVLWLFTCGSWNPKITRST